MIPDSTVQRALDEFMSSLAHHGRFESMREALKAVEGNFEQKFANEQVREGQRTGRCPTCGGDM